MIDSGLIDWHAHMLADRLTPTAGHIGAWPGIRVAGNEFELTLGGEFYRPVDARTFDADRRLADMDATGVSAQVVSPPPYASAFDGPAGEFAALARQQNEFFAGLVERHPGRFGMLGMLPYGTQATVDAELDHLEQLPGVLGVCLSAHRNDDLADLTHRNFWARVAGNRWTVFVHPADTAMCSCDLDSGAPFGAGMPLATARTAIRLLTSGVPEAVPGLRILLAHAGGALPAIVDRLDHGWKLGLHPNLACSPLATAHDVFWVDSIAYAPSPLRAAAATFGADRMVYGSDYPFTAMLRPADVEAVEPGTGLLSRLSDNGAALLAWSQGSP